MNKVTKVVFASSLVLALAVMSSPATSGQAGIVAKISRVLVIGDDTYGGCMAMLDDSPSNYLNCKPNWVTFSCTGDLTDPVRAYQMLDTAKLAYATERAVLVVITDDLTHDGYCFVRRIDGR
jgi:hypothetical protein